MSQTNPTPLTSAQEQFLLLNISDAIPAPIFYKDTNLQYIGCNKAFENLFQKTREEIKGKTVFDIYPNLPEKAQKITDRDHAFLASSETRYSYENNLIDTTGQKRHLIVTKAKFHHPDGTLAGLVAVMFENTEQKQAEEAFQREQILLQTLIDAIPSPIFYKDTEHRYLGCNKAFERVDARMEKKHFLGKISLDIFPPERATPIYERDKQFLAAHENQVIYEQAQPNEKGELRDYVVTKSKFFNPDSSFGGFVGITFDITERKKLENNLLQINKELAYKNHQITSSIEYASQIQNGILMDEKEIIEHFKEAFIFFQPKDIVSGDFYWFAKRDSIDFIAAVDCTGHGVPGALMTVLGNDFLNQIVYEQNITRPDLILSELDAKIKNTFHKRNPEKQITDGMELALCAIHRKTKQLYFSGARRPLWLARKNEIRIIPFSRFPISGKSSKKEKKFELHKLQIQKNDVLYLFTDGLQHQFDKPHGQKFSEKRLLKLLTKISSLSLKQQEKEVKMAFNKWKKNNFQTDDVLLIGVQPI